MLRPMTLLIAVSLLGIFVAAEAQTPPERATACALHVTITDEDGTPLPKAFVFIHNERGANQQATPDKTGQFKLSLHSGLYDMFISAIGFLPQAQIVDLRTCKPANINLMMTIDSEHTNNDNN